MNFFPLILLLVLVLLVIFSLTTAIPAPKNIIPLRLFTMPVPLDQTDVQLIVNDTVGENCPCGETTVPVKIVGGEAATLGEIPWRVGLFIGEDSGSGFGCCGTIIAKRWILTAAHCFDDSEDNFITTVSVGSLEYDPNILAKRHIIHEDYNPDTLENDIALLELNEDLNYSANVGPACLPYQYKGFYEVAGPCLGSGWGVTEEGGETPEILQKVVLNVISNAQCQDMTLPHPPLKNTECCAYTPDKDTCQGDSGGSIDVVNPNNKWYAFGIVSNGEGCAREGAPGVYTRISEYLPWIEEQTGESFCKPCICVG